MRALLLAGGVFLCACTTRPARSADTASGSDLPDSAAPPTDIQQKLAKYTTVRLTADLGVLSPRQREMIPLLIDAAKEMDAIFWMQAYGNRDSLLASVSDSSLRRFIEINYGPWDRLDGNEPFMPGVGEKPKGAAFYPADMTKEELERAGDASDGGTALRSLYTLVRRGANRELVTVPYSQAYAPQLRRAAEKLRAAARLAESAALRRYLELRAAALVSDDYQPSDIAWMEMKDNDIDVVIGPIETYEDQLFGYKAANEAFILIKDKSWSQRLARYATMLPALQRGLPVSDEFKRETPGAESELNAYDAVYYAGDANAGSKTIAINLPNDEQVQLQKGTRRLQLKNAMRAKFDKILVPIASELIDADQRRYIDFDSFFSNVMFHEVAHGLGIKNTINGKGTVRAALKEQASALEEGKADVLGLYMVSKLRESRDITDGSLENNYVTFLASIFRSVRFGASSAHGRANAAQFGFLLERGAFTRDEQTGTYRVDFTRMRSALDALAEQILRFQGTGDYDGVAAFMSEKGRIAPTLQADLDRLASKGIPVDVVFEQGLEVLQ
ncbi:MAG TPA: hypothetical protein VJ803_03965 [Gemmatimonadaceae bacterium]|nr:hypothetical protein [Gemmatimonadaceae bacterium]